MTPVVKAGGRVVGYLHECDDRIELLAPGGKVPGIYLIGQDQTIRPGAGGLVGYGNLLMTLLEE